MKNLQAKCSYSLPLLSGLYFICAFNMPNTAFAQEPFKASDYMTGYWGGLRQELHDKGYDFGVSYVGELGTNVHGGYNHDRTSRYADQVALTALIDLEKAFGWKGAEFKLAITDRNGQNISNDRIGDPCIGTLSSSKEVWGRGHRRGHFPAARQHRCERSGQATEPAEWSNRLR